LECIPNPGRKKKVFALGYKKKEKKEGREERKERQSKWHKGRPGGFPSYRQIIPQPTWDG